MILTTAMAVIAFCCYGMLLLVLLASEKNHIIQAFKKVIITCVLWSGGLSLMWQQACPGVQFWYNISSIGLLLIPCMLCDFIFKILQQDNSKFKHISYLGSCLVIFFNFWQPFCLVNVNVLPNGRVNVDFMVHLLCLLPTAFYSVMLFVTGKVIWNKFKCDKLSVKAVFPLFIGICLLLIGNLIQVLPFANGIPFGEISGLLLAVCMIFSMCKRRLFNLTLITTHAVIYAIASVLCAFLYMFMLLSIEDFIRTHIPQAEKFSILIISVLFASVTVILFDLLQKFINSLFFEEDTLKARKLLDFSRDISGCSNIRTIVEKMTEILSEILHTEKIYVFLQDENKDFICTKKVDEVIFLGKDSSIIHFLEALDSCITYTALKTSSYYHQIEKNDRQKLQGKNICGILPIKGQKNLAGIAFLIRKGTSLSQEEVTFADSIRSIASIAIKNASMREQVSNDLRIDLLTGLLNRRFFYETLSCEYDKAKEYPLALILLNLDDFKLFNQLYGEKKGDEVLQKVAQVLLAGVRIKGYAARYGGKEFAIILPHYTIQQAYQFACSMKEKIAHVCNDLSGEDSYYSLTLSGGVCAYPQEAGNMQQLLNYADMAVYNAKRRGKNRIVVYTHGQYNEKEIVSDMNMKLRLGKYEQYASTIYALTAAIDAKDHFTFNHSQNVARYSTTLAKEIGLNEEHVQIIYEAALLHDIGKISIPENILTKPGKLTEEEYKIMKSHVENSIDIIKHLPSLDYLIPAAIGHHERWDGKGYPRGLKGEAIPISARCLAIADAFDAMTSIRSYKNALPVDFAVKEIECNSGTQFDPHLSKVFVNLVKTGKISVTDIVNETTDSVLSVK